MDIVHPTAQLASTAISVPRTAVRAAMVRATEILGPAQLDVNGDFTATPVLISATQTVKMDTVAVLMATVKGYVWMDFLVNSALSSVLLPVPGTAIKRPDLARVSARRGGTVNSVKSFVQEVALLAPVIEALACAYLPVYLDSTGRTVTSHVQTVIRSVVIS